jgi:hypothetical protein
MTTSKWQYILGAVFIAFGIYQLTIKDYLETLLYAVAGLSFIVNTLSTEPKLISYKKNLAVASWILIITTGLLFFYLVQFKWF